MTDNRIEPGDPKEAKPANDAVQDQTDLAEGAVGTTYEPSTVEVNRAREQGLGVGQKDIDHQRDPTGDKSYEEY